MLLKANKQTVANALQRKANKVDIDPKLANIDSVLMLNTTGNGKTLLDRLNALEGSLEDFKTQIDLSFDSKLSRKVNGVEDELKKIF